jgi:hypothetical protein
MKYSKEFERDIRFYIKNRHVFNFDGSKEYYNKKGKSLIQYFKTGVDGIKAFHAYDSNGKILPTKHPNILSTILKAKGSINLNIKMWKEDYNNIWTCGRLLPECDVLQIMKDYNCPDWVYKAITGKEYNKKEEIVKTEFETYNYPVEL